MSTPDVESDAGQHYCPSCDHPWGYHVQERGCTMPLSQHGLPVSSLEVTARSCGCRVTPPPADQGPHMAEQQPVNAEKGAPWSCPDCPWVHRPHPVYGWAAHDTRAIEVHRTMLCPARVTPPAEAGEGVRNPAATVEIARIDAVLNLLWPEHITPTGKRMLQAVLDDAERGGNRPDQGASHA